MYAEPETPKYKIELLIYVAQGRALLSLLIVHTSQVRT